MLTQEEYWSRFDELHEYYGRIKEANGFTSIWSIYEVGENMDEVPFQNVLEVRYMDPWGTLTKIEVDSDPSWLDLWKIAGRLIVESGDDHHAFIENFVYQGKGIYHLVTGS